MTSTVRSEAAGTVGAGGADGADGADRAVEAEPVTLVTSDGERLEFGCAPGQSVLEAAAAAGMTLSASCRQGTCGSCHASVTGGAYDLGAYSPAALSQEQRDRGEVLLCRTSPCGPLSVTLPYDGSRILHGGIPERAGGITVLETVARDTVRLEIRLEPDEDMGAGCQFDPGRFVELQIPGSDVKRAYSLANTGNWDGLLEFYIRLRPDGVFSSYLRDDAHVGQGITVHGPQGAFGLRDLGLRPRWFVAGGTGLAPLLSMVRHMAEWQEPHPARLFLGVNEEAEVFGLAELDAVAAELPGFTYDVCVWRPDATWQGRAGTPADLVADQLATAQATPDIYMCGPPPMVDAVTERVTAAGVTPDRIFHERFLPS